MSLLLDEDYKIILDSGLEIEEFEAQRFVIFKNFPLPDGLYSYNGNVLTHAEILVQIPSNYNATGIDMLWTHPELKRTDGTAIPAAVGFGGGDPRNHAGQEYCRWSRHWSRDGDWLPKVDNVAKIISRISWALHNPDAVKQ
jgi:hypothetical protein